MSLPSVRYIFVKFSFRENIRDKRTLSHPQNQPTCIEMNRFSGVFHRLCVYIYIYITDIVFRIYGRGTVRFKR